VSAARHALGPAEVVVAHERPRWTEPALALLCVALSVAAVWLLLLPAIRETPPSVTSCVVVTNDYGRTIRCEDGATLTSTVGKPRP
jgi:hypothetical protein